MQPFLAMAAVPDAGAPPRGRRRPGTGTEVTIGVDIGTTAVKAVAVDGRGRICARARICHQVHAADRDTFEHDVCAAWQQGPRRAVAELGAAGVAGVGLGIAACVPSITVLDDDLVPLSSGILYGDARGRSGVVPDPVPLTPLDVREGAAFLGWAAKHWPGARAYWPAQAVAAVALGGPPVIDIFTAMAYFPVFNGMGWDPGWLADLGITPEQLPQVSPEFGGPAGHLPAGAPAGNARPAVLAAGGVDVVAEQVTVSLCTPGEVHVLCGTTLVTWAVVNDNGDVPGLWRIPHSSPGLALMGGPSNAGGLFLNWAGRLASTRPRGGTVRPDRVPLWIPYVRGERTPLHDTSLRASLHDLDLTHDAAAMRRAAYEAAGFVIRRKLELAGCVPTRIVATGGGVRDRAWMQAIADCTRTMVVRSAIPESAALGMAWLARMAAGLESSVADATRWFRAQQPVYPDERWMTACDRRYERFRALNDVPPPPVPAGSGAISPG
jgi:xylulokinase